MIATKIRYWDNKRTRGKNDSTFMRRDNITCIQKCDHLKRNKKLKTIIKNSKYLVGVYHLAIIYERNNLRTANDIHQRFTVSSGVILGCTNDKSIAIDRCHNTLLKLQLFLFCWRGDAEV